jgi:hypothetical protein
MCTCRSWLYCAALRKSSVSCVSPVIVAGQTIWWEHATLIAVGVKSKNH